MLFPWPKVGEFCGCEGGLINTIEMTKKISTQRPLPAASNKVSFSYYEPRSNRRAYSLKHHLLHPSERGINIFKANSSVFAFLLQRNGCRRGRLYANRLTPKNEYPQKKFEELRKYVP